MSTSTRVVFLTSTLEVGGSESKIVKVANSFARQGISTSIAYLNAPAPLLGRIAKEVGVVHLDRRGKYSWKSLRELCRLLAQGDFVVFVVNLYPLLYAVPLRLWLRRKRLRTICLVNTSEFLAGQRLFGVLYAPFLRACDQIVFGCCAQLESWAAKYRLTRERCSYIYNGVDTDFYAPSIGESVVDDWRAKLGISDECAVIGSVGRLAPEKNYQQLVWVVLRLRKEGHDVYLVLVGDGPERHALFATARSLGVERFVKFVGVTADVRPLLLGMDIFVLPSIAVETFSNAALEAMSLARPVILSDIGGASEMVEHGRSGYLFKPGDTEALTGLAAGLLNSREERLKLGRAARKRVENRFQFPTMVERYKELCERAM